MEQAFAVQNINSLLEGLEEAWQNRHHDSQQSRIFSQQQLDSHPESLVEAYALRNLGFFDYTDANYKAALEKLLRGRDLAHTLRDRVLLRDCINYAAAAYWALGDLETAALCVHQVYDINVQLCDEAGVISSLNNMGLVNHDLGQFELAKSTFTEALERSRVLGDRTREGTTLINLAITLSALEDFENAIYNFELSLFIFEELGAYHMVARNLSNLAEAQQKLGLFNDALLTIERAMTFCEQSNDRSTLVFNWINAAKIHIAQNNQQQALLVLEQAKKESEHLEIKSHLYQIHEQLSLVYRLQENWQKALFHADLHHKLERELRNENINKTSQAFSITRGLEKAQAEAERQRQKTIELSVTLEALERANLEKSELLMQLHQTTLELRQQVIRDPLTKAYNRRFFEERILLEFTRATKENRLLSVAMIDVDNFKKINDTFSHQVGDQVLQRVAMLLTTGLHPTDTLARYGGEEFALILPSLELEKAAVVCERLRGLIEHENWSLLHPELKVTVSIGVSSQIQVVNHEKMLQLADEKLYLAKNSGKNRVCV